VVYSGDLQGVADAIAYSDQGETASVFLVSHVSTYQRPDAGGIHVGDAGEFDDEKTGIVGAYSGLKVEEGCDD
jgi:hypothetical protein